MDKLVQKSLAEFETALASEDSVPGGGGAAAYTGALGSALCAMASKLTIGKKKYQEYWADLVVIAENSEKLGNELLALVDEDAEGFAPLAAAYSIPKDDPGRAETLEKATLTACEGPVRMTEAIAKAIELLEEAKDKSSKLLVSDVACGSILCAAALRCAAINVFVNTRTLNDREAAEKIDSRVRYLLDTYVPRAKAVADDIEKYLCERK